MKLIICGKTDHEITDEHVLPEALKAALAARPEAPIFMFSNRDAFLGEMRGARITGDWEFEFGLNLTPEGTRIMKDQQNKAFLYPEGIIHEKKGGVITRFELTAWSLRPRTGPRPK